MSGFRSLVDKAREVVEREKRVKIGKLAFKLGKSYTYTKYGIAKILIDLNECIKYEDDELVWVCDDGEG
ncbi:MAG: hypothetical protein GSR85_06955 [Desulfurococcales archaeon]|nr:hypothetical protein [Desulfurococcales archaeon]